MFRSRLRRLAVSLLALVFIAPGTWVLANEIPPSGGPIGVLIADHGEPPEYNEWTYYSFRKFLQHLIVRIPEVFVHRFWRIPYGGSGGFRTPGRGPRVS